ncbi:hypothetical protein EZY14_018865 [Kordia sp. TARA_039_SRF]|nr:hypothetical protein EZY14_018865 [Kordia sp. TARA_039_SRF]
MPQNIVIKTNVHILRTIFGVGFFLVGVVATSTGNLLGLIFCVISLLFFIREGSEIDLKRKQYRAFSDFFGIHFGQWKELPKIDYISVFIATERTIIYDFVHETEVKNKVIVLNLFYNGNQRIKVYTAKDKEDAFKVAKQISEILKIDILDATEAESKWI